MDDMSSCPHPVQIAGLCAVCGALLDSDEQSSTSIAMVHDSDWLRVSQSEAARLDSESTQRLLSQRKLALIVDLDQTIIHATVDPTVGDWMRDASNPNFEALRDVGKFRLGLDGKAILDPDEAAENGDGDVKSKEESSSSNGAEAPKPADEGCWYYVKPRPGLADFLSELSEKYELHVYTMGTRSYADCVCKLVDPTGRFFGSRILSRDENGSLVQKSLKRIFPMDTSMVVIIDDRADVWRWSPNLIKVVPYDFFLGSGDINATFLPAAPSVPAPTTTSPSDTTEEDPSALSPPGITLPASAHTSPSNSRRPSLQPSEASEADKAADAKQQQEEEAAAKAMADASQKVALNEQLDARPLQKMQEILDEKMSGRSKAPSEAPSATSSAQGSSKGSVSEGTVKAESGAEVSGDVAGGAGPAKAEEGGIETGKGAAPPAATLTTAPSPASSSAASDASGSAGTAPSSVPTTASPPVEQAPTQPQQHQAVLRDNDAELQRVKQILSSIHERWYKSYEDGEKKENSNAASKEAAQGLAEKPTVVDIIASLKADVFRGCDIVFSSVIPLGTKPERSDLWRLALEFGASCSLDVNKNVTHVVAAKRGTSKVNEAHRLGIPVVWPNWLHASAAVWAQQPVNWYSVPPMSASALAGAAAEEQGDGVPSDAWISASGEEWDDDGDDEDEEGEDVLDSTVVGGAPPLGEQAFANMNWSDADDEVNAFLDSDDEDSQAGGDADGEDEGEGGASTDTSRPPTPRRPSKRGRISEAPASDAAPQNGRNGTGSANNTDEESDGGGSDASQTSQGRKRTGTGSPLSKRRRMAEGRAAAGGSKLKQSITAGAEGNAVAADGDVAPGAAAKTERQQQGEETGGEWDTDGSQGDFLNALAEEMEMQLGDDDGG